MHRWSLYLIYNCDTWGCIYKSDRNQIANRYVTIALCNGAWADQRCHKVVSGMKNDLILLVLFHGIVQHRISRFYLLLMILSHKWIHPSLQTWWHGVIQPVEMMTYYTTNHNTHTHTHTHTHTLYSHLINKVIIL